MLEADNRSRSPVSCVIHPLFHAAGLANRETRTGWSLSWINILPVVTTIVDVSDQRPILLDRVIP
jgi:hypothetical protein